MRAGAQRVSSASGRVDGEGGGAVERGALGLRGVLEDDGERELERAAGHEALEKWDECRKGGATEATCKGEVESACAASAASVS